MEFPRVSPYGSWASPLTADLIAADPVRLGEVAVTSDRVFWSEGRPSEQGRNAVVEMETGTAARDLLPAPYNARSLVHEYGGGALAASDEAVFFVNFDPTRPGGDQRIHRCARGGVPQPLTRGDGGRFGGLHWDRAGQRLLAVRETAHVDREPQNDLVAIDPAGGSGVTRLVWGDDFYGAPAVSPDGRRIAWTCWNHPDMPWIRSDLWMGALTPDGVVNPRQIAGGPGVAVMQPRFSPNGILHFITDETGWWNLARLEGDRPVAIAPCEAEFGAPQWQLGESTYDFLDDGKIVAAACTGGLWSLSLIDPATGVRNILDLPHTTFRAVHAAGDMVVAIAASPRRPEALVRIDPRTLGVETLRSAFDLDPDVAAFVSTGEPVRFPTTNGATAHGFYYPPVNPRFEAPPEDRPPLLVMSHGGPTASSTSALNLSRQFWTSRGFAVIDVNYRGSTGYGRPYRLELEGRWGLADVDDCMAAARHLIDRGDADPERVGITGGSAGGYTTLCALTFHDMFAAGASRYGIGDLEALATGTHKFESRYLDWLVGPYPERRDLYRERSPIHHVDRLGAPIIFLQGGEDRVVPPDQAEAMVAALRAKRIPVAYLLFEHEQHGFRKAENIKRALDGELMFFSIWLSGAGLRF